MTPSPFQSWLLNETLFPFHSARLMTPSPLSSRPRKRGATCDDCGAGAGAPFAQYLRPPEPGTPQSPKLLLYSAELTNPSATTARPRCWAVRAQVFRPPGSG